MIIHVLTPEIGIKKEKKNTGDRVDFVVYYKRFQSFVIVICLNLVGDSKKLTVV